MRRYSVRAAALLAVVVLVVGCASVAPGSDPILVRGEQSLSVSFAILDSFVRVEYNNRSLVQAKAPQLSALAEQIRRNAPALLRTATQAVDMYRALKTPAAQDAMFVALSQPEALAAQASSALATVSKLQGGTTP